LKLHDDDDDDDDDDEGMRVNYLDLFLQMGSGVIIL
jgi:hypothetical protein